MKIFDKMNGNSLREQAKCRYLVYKAVKIGEIKKREISFSYNGNNCTASLTVKNFKLYS